MNRAGASSLAALALFFASCHQPPADPPPEWALSPREAVEGIAAPNLYYNGVARAWLREHRPDLLRPETTGESFAQAAENPKLFRQLDRQQRFDSVLLVGDATQYRPLLDHLVETGDWKLTLLTPSSLVFQRNAGTAWSPEALTPLRARIEGLPPRVRAQVLAPLAAKLAALRQYPLARSLLEQALQADGQNAEAWSTQGRMRMALGDWKGALESARKAVQYEPKSVSALACLAQALYGNKRFNEAYEVSSRLVKRMPDDPAILFYHGRIAHEAKAYEEEAASLRHLIALAEKSGRPISGYQVYLGQALGKIGEGEEALATFARAIADPELPPEQRKFAEECVARLHERMAK